MKKKGQSQIGIAIIIMALLLLFGSYFLNNTGNQNLNNNQLSKNNSYVFSLSKVGIGKQIHQIQNYPNIILGSKKKSEIIFVGNTFRLNSNIFNTIPYSFEVQLNNPKNVKYLLLYFDLNKISGNQNLIILVNNKIISENHPDMLNLPIKIYNIFNNSKKINNLNNSNNNDITNSKIKITFLIKKPSWYSIFNWNKFDINNLKIVQVSQNKKNNERNFDFVINKKFLEKTYINSLISCDKITENSPPIQIKINGFLLSNENPKCSSKNTIITTQIPNEILTNEKNRITFKTDGFYKLGFRINKIYFNNIDNYKFNINNYNNLNDIIMHGDFNKNVIDIDLNGNLISLKRNEYLSILKYIKVGVNRLKFLEKPLIIKSFTIEKTNINSNNNYQNNNNYNYNNNYNNNKYNNHNFGNNRNYNHNFN